MASDSDKHNSVPKYMNNMMFMKQRFETFKNWAYPNDANCSPYKMAEAGFFADENDEENNCASCWVCHKTMYWDIEDDPKIEHANHSPNCHFVKIALNKKEMDLTFGELYDLIGASLLNFKIKSKDFLMDTLKRELQEFQKMYH